MSNIVKHATLNGEIKSMEYSASLTPEKFKEFFENDIKNLDIEIIKKNTSSNPYNYILKILDRKLNIHMIYKKISHGGIKRSPNEQRIQTEKGQANHIIELNSGNVQNSSGYIITYYKPSDNSLDSVYILMKPYELQTGGNVSRQIDIKEISKGMALGYNKYIDRKDNIIIICKKDYLKPIFYEPDLFFDYESTTKAKKNISSLTTIEYPYNRIIFGAPGTGKSYLLKNDSKLFGDNFERVTFYPGYNYSQFVGTYKPIEVINKNNNENELTYTFVPGPFIRIISDAINNPDTPFLLIIEEINRANVGSVFGDIFQLLDRNEDGYSEYKISITEDLYKHLKLKCTDNFKEQSLFIPENVFIWATMNSSDQGVYPLDTAFKRRWSFEYLDVNNNEHLLKNYKFNIGKYCIYWNDLRTAINKDLLDININEDKLIGTFFISISDLKHSDDSDFNILFKNKVLMYLYDDVLKYQRGSFFNENIKTFSDLCLNFDELGLSIFKGNNILQLINKDDNLDKANEE